MSNALKLAEDAIIASAQKYSDGMLEDYATLAKDFLLVSGVAERLAHGIVDISDVVREVVTDEVLRARILRHPKVLQAQAAVISIAQELEGKVAKS